MQQRKEEASASMIQRNVRSYLKFCHLARIQHNVGFVQAFWRGCLARSRSSSLISQARERVKAANANVEEDMMLGNRTSAALQVLLESKALNEVFEAIKTLEVATRFSSVCCNCFAQETDAIQTIYGLIRSCNRSQPHRKLLLHALRVLNNVWPFEMKVARGRNATISPSFGPRMDILVDLMQVRVILLLLFCCCFAYVCCISLSLSLECYFLSLCFFLLYLLYLFDMFYDLCILTLLVFSPFFLNLILLYNLLTDFFLSDVSRQVANLQVGVSLGPLVVRGSRARCNLQVQQGHNEKID
jgi:hypothetical protein